MDWTKRSAGSLAAVLLVSFTAAALAHDGWPISKAARMTDRELDAVVAGFSLNAISNNGSASILKFNNNHVTCINQCTEPVSGNGASGAVLVVNNGHPDGMIHTVGKK